MPSPRTRWLITLAAPLVAVVGLELGLRVAGFEHMASSMPLLVWNGLLPDRPEANESMHQLDVRSLWSLRPGALVGKDSSERINSHGLRGPEVLARLAGTQRVVLMGESTMFGLGVPWELTCAPQLEATLERRGLPAQVLNAAVTGHSVLQGLERYRAVVRPLEPDVVCAAFGLAAEYSPCQGLPDADKLALAREERVGMTPFRERWPGLRVLQLVDWCLHRREEDELRRVIAQRALEREDGSDAMGLMDWPGCRRVPLDQFGSGLRELAGEVRADGRRLLLISLPRIPAREVTHPIQTAYSQRLADTAAALGVPLVDVRGAVYQAVADGADPASFFISGDSLHLGPKGQALLATMLSDAIADVTANRGSR